MGAAVLSDGGKKRERQQQRKCQSGRGSDGVSGVQLWLAGWMGGWVGELKDGGMEGWGV